MGRSFRPLTSGPSAAAVGVAAPFGPVPLRARPSARMQRRDDSSARMGRGPGGPGGARQGGPNPRRSPRGGGGRGAGAQQPQPLLTGGAAAGSSGAQGPAAANPAPLLPGGAVKMEPENKYLPELMAEKDSLDPSFVHAMRLLADGKPSFPPATVRRSPRSPAPCPAAAESGRAREPPVAVGAGVRVMPAGPRRSPRTVRHSPAQRRSTRGHLAGLCAPRGTLGSRVTRCSSPLVLKR